MSATLIIQYRVERFIYQRVKKMYDDVRKIIPTFKEDQVMYPFIQKVKTYMMEN